MLKCRAIMLILVLFVSACKKENSTPTDLESELTKAPIGFPEIPFTEENPFTLAKWEMGKKLFYDKMLSIDYSVSCASCHKPELAFSDDVAVSVGAHNRQGKTNAPTLTNVVYHPYYTRAGGVPTLEMQVLVPIQEHDEFDFNIVEIAKRMNAIPEYVEMSQKCFGRNPDAYVITRAIGIFERTLVSGNSAYDKYTYQGISNALTQSAQRGLQLFNSERAKCNTCHSGFNFTNNSFQNNGLYTTYADNGRRRFTQNENDEALFKVPTLRNVALSAPYMHDGSLATLYDVVEHYNSGGQTHVNKNDSVKPLRLTEREKKDLVAFLESLTDYQFINNQNFYNNEQ